MCHITPNTHTYPESVRPVVPPSRVGLGLGACRQKAMRSRCNLYSLREVAGEACFESGVSPARVAYADARVTCLNVRLRANRSSSHGSRANAAQKSTAGPLRSSLRSPPRRPLEVFAAKTGSDPCGESPQGEGREISGLPGSHRWRGHSPPQK